ncbi:MAG: thioredoxin domain-containing protein [Desulfobacterales bacterium]|jgi:thioredoxin|nr:thioredoxin domain-containing protein [Desulfobacterales bacterium]
MAENIECNTRWVRFFIRVVTVFSFLVMVSCGNNTDNQPQDSAKDSVIGSINSLEQFNKIMETSKERLLILDFYADWCPPCKELFPVLEKIGKENRNIVTIYKINIDRHSELANSFRVTGIPHVAFVKNKENVLSLTGLYPKKMYLKVIQQYSENGTS